MEKGVYLLLIGLPRRKKIEVGSLGEFKFEAGIYCYVGSGMNGLDKRVERHKSSDKKKHWHIDYFLDEGEVLGVLKLRTEKDLECRLNDLASEISEDTPVKGFGSSDCGCESHFHYLY